MSASNAGRRMKRRFSDPSTVALNEFTDLNLARLAPGYQRWVLDVFGRAIGGEVLEVGPGVGNFTRFLARRAVRVTAVEPEPLMADAILAMGLPNVTVVRAPIESLDASRGRFTCAVALNVLEHLRDDVGALRAIGDLLEPGGAVCILVPAHETLYGTLDERYGHFRRYSRSDVGRLIVRAGLRSSMCRYFNPLGAIGWFVVARVLRSTRVPPVAVRLTERIGVPIGRALERFGPPRLGQSVIAVARRPLG